MGSLSRRAFLTSTLATLTLPSVARAQNLSRQQQDEDINLAFELSQTIANNPVMRKAILLGREIARISGYERFEQSLESVRLGRYNNSLQSKGEIAYCITEYTQAALAKGFANRNYRSAFTRNELKIMDGFYRLSVATALTLDARLYNGESIPNNCVARGGDFDRLTY